MKMQLLRHATTIIHYAGKKILVDPVLSPAGVRNPIPTRGKGKGLRNPLVDIPLDQKELEQLIHSMDAILITHTHADHFDDFKGTFLPKHIPILCQPEDTGLLSKIGFPHIQPVEPSFQWEGIQIIRTPCKHGGIYWSRKMGTGSGYVLKANTEKTLYITGDTIWCNFVRDAIDGHNPEIMIIYSGAAQFPFGRSITMNQKDIQAVCKVSKESQKIFIHMEAINHCHLTRNKLAAFLQENNIAKNTLIPQDGEMFDLNIQKV